MFLVFYFETNEKVREAIKGVTDNLIITKKGMILAIGDGTRVNYGNSNETEILNMEVDRVQRIGGTVAIRVKE